MDKLILGVGINDANYSVTPRIEGRQVVCPIYAKWRNMLTRCYYQPFKDKNPTYLGCSVDKSWHLFSNFHSWVDGRDVTNLHLDKDLKVLGNKVYGPDTCLLITDTLNKKLIKLNSNGVSVKKPKGKRERYEARITVKGKRIHLGSSTDRSKVEGLYSIARSKLIKEEACNHSKEVRECLINLANEILKGVTK